MSPTSLSFFILAGLAGAQCSPCSPAGRNQPDVTGFLGPAIRPSRGGQAVCVSGTIPVTASAKNLVLPFPEPANQLSVSEIVVSAISAGPSSPQEPVFLPVSGTYNISGTLCIPANGTTKPAVHFLTHGLGFDRYYWDFAPGYSYVDYAAQHGYATFLYDRLGVGLSEKVDALKDEQSPLELAIAAELVGQLRRGAVGGTKFAHVVGVGHSFGSAITQGLTNVSPQLVDAAVLTGFSLNTTGQPLFISALNLAIASQNVPYRFTGLPNGYLVAGSAISNQIGFFKAPNFDPQILAMAEAQKATLTFGELLTTAAVIKRAANFTGPVAIVNGASDLPFCGGNCSYPVDQLAVTRLALYPAARNVTSQTYEVPLTGHGINLHLTAPRAYHFMLDFITNAGF